MKITLDQLRELIFEAIENVSHDTASDGIESMQHQLETEAEKPKGRKKKRRKINRK